jgi:hypothetical protein
VCAKPLVEICRVVPKWVCFRNRIPGEP